MRFCIRTTRLSGAFALTAVALGTAQADEDMHSKLNQKAQAALEQCQTEIDACADMTAEAAGVLAFPEVTSASIGIGGSGATGVLWINGEVDGYYTLAKGSIGPQIGFRESSQVYALDETALGALKKDGSWKVSSEAGVTVMEGESAQGVSGTGGTKVFVFNREGLSAGVSVEGVRIEKAEEFNEANGRS